MNIDEFPVQVRVPVAFVDMGMANHVNNSNFFRYFEEARAKFFDEVGLTEMYAKRGIGALLAKIECQFVQSLTYPDNLIIGARVSSIRKTSFVIQYLIVSEKVGVAAIGKGIAVTYDYNAAQKIIVPEEIRTAIEKLDAVNPSNVEK